MAVINTVDDVLTQPQPAAEVGGAALCGVTKVIPIAAADDNASIFLIAELPDTAIVDAITLETPAITGGTAYDVGLYNADGTVIDADVFAANLDLSDTTGLPTGPLGDPIRQAMTALALADANKKLYEIAGHVNKAFPATGDTNRKSKYRIALTADTIGTGAGTIVARVTFRKSP